MVLINAALGIVRRRKRYDDTKKEEKIQEKTYQKNSDSSSYVSVGVLSGCWHLLRQQQFTREDNWEFAAVRRSRETVHIGAA